MALILNKNNNKTIIETIIYLKQRYNDLAITFMKTIIENNTQNNHNNNTKQ